MYYLRLALVSACFCTAALHVHAENSHLGLARVSPEQVGLSSDRLGRIEQLMRKYIDENRIAGAMALIARRGKIAYAETFGMSDTRAGKPMRDDTIHRIFSMTKPIASVAVMTLYEEGHFFLNDPVSKYIPELGNLQVGTEEEDPSTGKKKLNRSPSKRDMTVRDLLRHTSGLTYGIFGNTLVDQEYRKAGNTQKMTLAEMVAHLGRMPLLYEPGTTWHYSVSTDVLGRFVEVISGMPFDEFLQARIFDPLGMKDTGFYVPREKKHRLSGVYTPKPDGTVQPMTPPNGRSFTEPPINFSGGGGLVSTTADYLRFCQMLLNGGALDGVRILGRKTVELMTTDHLGKIPMGLGRTGYGFGLGFAVNPGPGKAGAIGSAGEYSWGGAAGTRFWIDPKEEMIGIFMIQIWPHRNLRYGEEFKLLAYQAIVD